MRLLRCHIENFGKLHDLTLDFTDNLTVITEHNGWGKSTLAAFIKVMFYGFANEKKRGDALERERVRFKPWQGGVCGGELEFETGGKRYLLNRTFGAKEAEDTFALYDADTNLRTEDFFRDGVRDIGEELFQINQESFLRTVFIAQNDCVTGITDSINAKLGNLADNLDDINNYEKVQQVLKDKLNRLSPSRKTGELRKVKDEIDELKNELRRRDVVLGAIAELENRLEACNGEKQEAAAAQQALQEELLALGRRKEAEAKRAHYERILQQCEERQAAVENCEREFGGKMPTRSALQEAMELRDDMVRRQSDMAANRLSPAEEADLAAARERFVSGVPEQAFFAQGRECADRLEALRKEAAERGFSAEEQREAELLERRFGGRNVREEEIDYYLQQWNLRSEIKSGLGTKRATLSSLKLVESSAAAARQKARAGKESKLIFLLPLCLLGIGIALYFLMPAAGVGLMAAAVLTTAVLLAVRAAGRKRAERESHESDSGVTSLEEEIAGDEAAMARAQEEVLRFLDGLDPEDASQGQEVRDRLYALKNDLRRLGRLRARRQDYQALGYEGRAEALEREICALLEPYYTEAEMRQGNPRELFTELENVGERCLRLGAKEEKYRLAKERYTADRVALDNFLAEFGQTAAEDTDVCLQRMSHRLMAYENDMAELEKGRMEREEFEQTYDVSSFAETRSLDGRGMEEVKARLQAVSERLETIHESRNSYLVQLDERQQEAEQIEAQAERLAELVEQYERGVRYYRDLELASEYLARAKERFSSRYMEPIMRAFRRYLGMMSEASGEDFRIDANICITKREAGEQRDTRALSTGSQDLIGIALRMALVDAMYQRELPFLIFDDPFTNLDGERLEHARHFLRRIAEKYQVIYFTCHESRA